MSSSHPHLSSPSTSFHPPSIDPHPSIGLDDDVAELQLDGDGDDDSLHPTTVDDTEPLDLEADDDAYSPQHQLDTQTHSLPSPHPPQPAALPPAPPPPPAAVIQPVKQAASSPRTSLSSRSAAKEREQRVILPITAAPITRQNQDDTVVGIQPHHVDFEESGEDEDEEQQQLADGTERGEIWYEQELEEDDEEEEEEVWKAPTIDTTRDNDREVSDIMSRTPSYSQQRAKELAIVAAIKAEKERYPGQIITSPPSIPPTSATSSSSSSTTSASSTTKAKAASTIAAVAKVGQEGGPSPAFSYPGGGTATKGGGVRHGGNGMYGEASDEKLKAARVSASSVSPAPPSPSTVLLSSMPLSRWLLLSYGMALFGSVMFQFAAIVMLMHLFEDTLLPASLFGLVESISHALSPLLIRSLLSSTAPPSRWVLCCSQLSLHVSIVACSLVFHYSLTSSVLSSRHMHWVVLIVILLLGMSAKLAQDITQSAVHALSASVTHGSHALKPVEVSMSLLSPMFFGAVSTYNQPDVAVLVCVGWSAVGGMLTLGVGCGSSSRVRRKRVGEGGTSGSGGDGGGGSGSSGEDSSKGNGSGGKRKHKVGLQVVVHSSPHTPDDQHGHIASPTASSLPSSTSASTGCCGPILSLFHHPQFLPALSYAFLSLSILSFSVDMIAFLSTANVSDFALGAGRSLSTLLALLPPLFIDRLTRRLSLPLTGVISVWLQCVLLSPIVVIFMLTDRHAVKSFVVPLYVCLCFGTLSQSAFTAIESPLVIRHNINNGSSSSGSSQSNSLALRILVHMAIFVSYLLTVICFDPNWFFIPVAISFGCCVLAAIVYTLYACRGGRGREYSAVGGGGGMELVGMVGGKGRRGSEEVEEVDVDGELDGEDVMGEVDMGVDGDGDGVDEYEVRMSEDEGRIGHVHSLS